MEEEEMEEERRVQAVAEDGRGIHRNSAIPHDWEEKGGELQTYTLQRE
jgi:hypothetical protein